MKTILCALFLLSSPAFAALSAFPSFVSFYNVPVNGFGQSQSVTVQNSGPDNANPSVSGCFGDFQVSNFCFSIPAGSSCQIQIRFAPSRVGYQSCTIFVSDGLNGSTSINVSGQGVQ
jgi:hypothetical protein